MSFRSQTVREEVANALTHGIGAALSLGGLVWLLVDGVGGALHTAVGAVYGAAVTAQFVASATYHAVPWPRAKLRWMAIDHAAIFVLIAGTWTPFLAVSLGGALGAGALVAVWAVALAGAALETVFLGRWWKVSTALYVVLGWAGVLAAWPLASVLPWQAFAWLLAGGLAYTGGVGFFCWERLRGHHVAWHLCVLLGAACHFVAVRGYVLTPA